MWKHVLLYGVLGGSLVAVLRLVEYRWLIVEHSMAVYGGLIAALFAGLGLWLGRQLRQREIQVEVREVVVAASDFVRDEARVQALGLTPRELEMLEMIAAGFSNKEIAGKAFVSENTVKTHLSRVFEKLGARRRTQAVQLAKAARVIP